ncbi:MAG: prepilin-type N-terminal cleavage/methylation domain-containing protein [Woeseiaceae bacterium]|nr:prepilin-type N-terminal cleavage/methylation domain-containing protein [Woeseiaceae bacterium]
MFGNSRKRQSGITLLELMIVVVIISLMAVIAYPNYREFVARAKRNEARALLLEIAQNQERFYLQNNRYGNMGELGYADPQITDTQSYSVTIGAADANNFNATATFLLGGAEAAKCLTFGIDGRGTQTSAPDADCWTKTR